MYESYPLYDILCLFRVIIIILGINGADRSA